MKKKLLVVLVMLLCFAFLMAEAKPYTYTISKGVAECLVADRTLDEVWAGATKTLLLIHYNIVQADKASGIITARRDPLTFSQMGDLAFQNLDFRNSEQVDAPTLKVMIKTRNIGVSVMCNVQHASKIPLKRFCKGLEEALYGKVTNKQL